MIVAKTGKGDKFLRVENDARQKLSFMERQLLRNLFIVEVSEMPFSILFKSKNRLAEAVKPDALVKSIEDNMQVHGCVKGEDYEVFVESGA